MRQVTQIKTQLRRILWTELALIGLIAVIWFLTGSPSYRAVVIGALVGWLASSCYFYLALRFTRPGHPDRIYQGFSRAAMVKWLVAIVGLSLALNSVKNTDAGWLILGFITQILVHGLWVARAGHKHRASA